MKRSASSTLLGWPSKSQPGKMFGKLWERLKEKNKFVCKYKKTIFRNSLLFLELKCTTQLFEQGKYKFKSHFLIGTRFPIRIDHTLKHHVPKRLEHILKPNQSLPQLCLALLRFTELCLNYQTIQQNIRLLSKYLPRFQEDMDFLTDLEMVLDGSEHPSETFVKVSSRSDIRNYVKTPLVLQVSSWSLRGHAHS